MPVLHTDVSFARRLMLVKGRPVLVKHFPRSRVADWRRTDLVGDALAGQLLGMDSQAADWP